MTVTPLLCYDNTMAFVKLDCGMLDSTIWFDRESREVFITALLMAEPREFKEPQPQYELDQNEPTGWIVPAGWYGFVPASGEGIIRRCGINFEAGITALYKLGAPDQFSRTPDYDGRRLVRVDGGFIVLNFMKYRDRDYTGAERQKRWRERKKMGRVTPLHNNDVTSVTQAEAEAEAEEYTKRERRPKFVAPTIEEVKLQAAKIGMPEMEAEKFFNHYESNGWKVGKNPMRSWHSAISGWNLRCKEYGSNGNGKAQANSYVYGKELDRVQNKIKTIVSQYDSHQTKTPEDRAALMKLRAREKELTDMFGCLL